MWAGEDAFLTWITSVRSLAAGVQASPSSCSLPTHLAEGREGEITAWNGKSQREVAYKTASWSHKNTQLSEKRQIFLIPHLEI